MANKDNYEISDSFLGRVGQYTSSVWDSWGKDVDEYVDDVMETDSRSDDELYGSTILQDSAHSVELVAHLVGSVFSNDYTKERVHELGSAIASTDTYTSAIETVERLETQIDQASEQFMKEHPKVQTAFMASQEKLGDAISYVTKEAQTFTMNHPELTNDFKSILEIAGVVPAVKAARVANGAREGIYTYTANEAKEEIDKLDLNLLKPKEIEQELHRIINHLDTTPKDVHPDATTALYSGIPKEDMKQFVNDPNYALLDNTEAFKFLDKLYEKDIAETGHPLIPALKKVYDTDEIDFNDRNTPANIFLNGDDSVFPRQQGAWDIISHQFVKGSEGNVLTIVGEKASAQRVFKGTEFVTAALNKDITQLDGFDKKELFKTLEKEPSLHHQLNHFKNVHYTRTEVAKALEVKDPLSLTPDKIDDFLKSSTPEAKEISAKIEDFKTNIDHTATEAMKKELGENRDASPIMERRGAAVGFTKTDVALATAASIAIASETKEVPLDTTAKAQEIIGNIFPEYQANNTYTQQREITKDESNSSQSYEDRDMYSSTTFENSNAYSEDESFSAPKNHRPIALQDNLVEEQEFDQEEQFGEAEQRIYDDIAEKYGNNDDYGNEYDMGMEID